MVLVKKCLYEVEKARVREDLYFREEHNDIFLAMEEAVVLGTTAYKLSTCCS